MSPQYKTVDEMLAMYDDKLLAAGNSKLQLSRPIYKTASQVLADFEHALR
ncbi:MAG: hypothetical protein QNI90_05230 [Dinoroseobacter sp.]|nr:hypothetical protein [Dinoroseobacter sp.]MDJ0992954.1 hypothetical protein [Dinoroseobacter sp.]